MRIGSLTRLLVEIAAAARVPDTGPKAAPSIVPVIMMRRTMMRGTVMRPRRRQVKAGDVAAKRIESVHVRQVGNSRHMGHSWHVRHPRAVRGTMVVWSMMGRAVMMRRRHGSNGWGQKSKQNGRFDRNVRIVEFVASRHASRTADP